MTDSPTARWGRAGLRSRGRVCHSQLNLVYLVYSLLNLVYLWLIWGGFRRTQVDEQQVRRFHLLSTMLLSSRRASIEPTMLTKIEYRLIE